MGETGKAATRREGREGEEVSIYSQNNMNTSKNRT